MERWRRYEEGIAIHLVWEKIGENEHSFLETKGHDIENGMIGLIQYIGSHLEAPKAKWRPQWWITVKVSEKGGRRKIYKTAKIKGGED